MAVGLPLKTTYADGDVWSASDANDITGTINANASPYAAGKNKIVNGDFGVNQRNFTSATANQTYTFDRWVVACSATTITLTPQTFTAGTAPVAGYEGKNFIRSVTTINSTINDVALLQQRIEDVRTFAGQTMTVSFWAKAASGTPKVQPIIEQNFGSGGSAVVVTLGTAVTLTTSWARYTATFSVPSISGKTIGTSSSLYVEFGLTVGTGQTTYGTIGTQAATIDLWGVQAENGSTATAFQTATGNPASELAACQRYYQRFSYAANGIVFANMSQWSTTNGTGLMNLPVTMRTTPSSLDYSGVQFDRPGAGVVTATSVTINGNSGNTQMHIGATAASGLTAATMGFLSATTSSSYIGFSAEL
jgi:hypothetical protein